MLNWGRNACITAASWRDKNCQQNKQNKERGSSRNKPPHQFNPLCQLALQAILNYIASLYATELLCDGAFVG
jgi:hypothetical protein